MEKKYVQLATETAATGKVMRFCKILDLEGTISRASPSAASRAANACSALHIHLPLICVGLSAAHMDRAAFGYFKSECFAPPLCFCIELPHSLFCFSSSCIVIMAEGQKVDGRFYESRVYCSITSHQSINVRCAVCRTIRKAWVTCIW
jgi:hypothetical protein